MEFTLVLTRACVTPEKMVQSSSNTASTKPSPISHSLFMHFLFLLQCFAVTLNNRDHLSRQSLFQSLTALRLGCLQNPLHSIPRSLLFSERNGFDHSFGTDPEIQTPDCGSSSNDGFTKNRQWWSASERMKMKKSSCSDTGRLLSVTVLLNA